jgi:hypothetical protein
MDYDGRLMSDTVTRAEKSPEAKSGNEFIDRVFQSPEELIAYGWTLMIRGKSDPRHAFHTPCVATVALADDGRLLPELRTVVLRKADEQARLLVFHTDVRSPKIRQLRSNPVLAWHFYDAKARMQVRVQSVAMLHHEDDLARQRWKASQVMSRLCYLTPFTPGSEVSFPPTQAGKSEHEMEGFEQFVVVEARVTALDVLHLHHGGHRRAGVHYAVQPIDKGTEAGGGHAKAQWLAP